MDPDEVPIAYSEADHRPVIEVGGTQAATLADLIRAAPALKHPDHLLRYCGAMNHLQYGSEYQLIAEPESYCARYEEKYQAEDPSASFQEGSPRLRDFGHCELGEIQLPRLEGKSVIFYVEDRFLGIPYRVTGPAPSEPVGEVQYEPVPIQEET